MTKVEAVQADITSLQVDAIVNAANSSLMGGGGVDGAIHRAGGPAILEECKKIVAHQGPCPTGEAVITGAGQLEAKYVIHTVGPVWNPDEDQSAKLANCYTNSLALARQYQCKSIAFPNISTGVYGYPVDEAATVAVKSIKEYISEVDFFRKIVLCCFGRENYSIHKQELSNL